MTFWSYDDWFMICSADKCRNYLALNIDSVLRFRYGFMVNRNRTKVACIIHDVFIHLSGHIISNHSFCILINLLYELSFLSIVFATFSNVKHTTLPHYIT